MKSEEQRINNIIGQLEGIKKMMASDSDCFAVLTQIKAVRSALHSLSSSYLSDRFMDCLESCNTKNRKKTCSSFIEELIK